MLSLTFRDPQRNGFSLLELLVVMLILATLVGLLLPAVQRVRESAARIKCANNLKQLGLAVHCYESRVGWLPDCAKWYWDCDGWISQIAPDMEQSLSIESANRTVVCPSRRGVVNSAWYWYGGFANLTDYASVVPHAVQEGYFDEKGPKDGYRGMLVRRGFGRVALVNVNKGTSNTLMLGEKWKDKRYYYVNEWFDDAAWYGGFDPDQTRSTLYPPKADNEVVDYQSFGSAHPNGLNMVYGDGSVRFVRYDVDFGLWHSSGKRY